jgi:hypothetical protein
MLDKRPEPDAGPGFIEVADYLKIRENRPSVLAECEGSRGRRTISAPVVWVRKAV